LHKFLSCDNNKFESGVNLNEQPAEQQPEQKQSEPEQQ
jgi:hypothetical protein